jgi:hypothetical protein
VREESSTGLNILQLNIYLVALTHSEAEGARSTAPPLFPWASQGFVVPSRIAENDGVPFRLEGGPQRSAGTRLPDALCTLDALRPQTRVPEIISHGSQGLLELLLVPCLARVLGPPKASCDPQVRQASPASMAVMSSSTSLNARTRPPAMSWVASRSPCCQASLEK